MSFEILQGDALTVLRTMPDESVNCCVTSPPYWGLRDYGVAPLVWGGTEGCEHEWDLRQRKSASGGLGGSGLQGAPPGLERRPTWSEGFCSLCSAWRGSLGLEPTPELYVQHIVEIFREVRRVLRADGTLWLNLGDSYTTGAFTRQGNPRNVPQMPNDWAGTELGGRKRAAHATPDARHFNGLKPKDLIGIPWLVAFALQADGWWLRSDIIWAKLNPMPESVTDRPTKSHEYIFLLSKSGSTLLWRHDRTLQWTQSEPDPDYVWRDRARVNHKAKGPQPKQDQVGNRTYTGFNERWDESERGDIVEQAQEPENWRTELMADGKKRWSRINLWGGFDYYYDAEAIREPHAAPYDRPCLHVGADGPASDNAGAMSGRYKYGKVQHPAGRNKRSVWTVATYPVKDAHFATYPPDLIEPCILAGCPPDGTVLDPFSGSGTTGLACLKHGRRYIGIELNPDYIAISQKRLDRTMPLLATSA